MKHMTAIIVGILLASCTTLKAISAKVTTKSAQNQAPAQGSASASPTGPVASTSEQPPAPRTTEPAMIGGGHGKMSAPFKGGPDILGIRLGMTQEEASRKLEAYQPGSKANAQPMGHLIALSIGSSASTKAKGSTLRELILVTCVVTNGRSIVAKVERNTTGPTDPTDLAADLKKKYGSHVRVGDGNPGIMAWGWDDGGRPVQMPNQCSLALSNACVGVDTHLSATMNPHSFAMRLESKSMNDLIMLTSQQRNEALQKEGQRKHDEAAKANKPSL
jgi:hypothetical protein